jgi:hypothetical protein
MAAASSAFGAGAGGPSGSFGSLFGAAGALAAGALFGPFTAAIVPDERLFCAAGGGSAGGGPKAMALSEKSFSRDVWICISGNPVRLASSRSEALPSIRESTKPSAAPSGKERSALASATTLGMRSPSANRAPR